MRRFFIGLLKFIGEAALWLLSSLVAMVLVFLAIYGLYLLFINVIL